LIHHNNSSRKKAIGPENENVKVTAKVGGFNLRSSEGKLAYQGILSRVLSDFVRIERRKGLSSCTDGSTYLLLLRRPIKSKDAPVFLSSAFEHLL
jgi:hypothetical protein